MFRRTSPQLSLFDPTVMFPGILPWMIGHIFIGTKFCLILMRISSNIYTASIGEHQTNPLSCKSLFDFNERRTTDWRDAAYHLQRRLDWMNATQTPCDMNQIDHTTLHKFYDRIAEDEVVYDLFMKLTGQFILECKVSTKQQRTDSFLWMAGWLNFLVTAF